MPEEMLVRHCSPTLAGIKTGNLFGCDFKSEREMRECLRRWNRLLTAKGLRVLPMRFREGRALIYLYRPARLTADLRHDLAGRLLRERGYSTETAGRCVAHLIRRLGEYEDFPHEIGLFLGYPPEDVCGFIENKAGGCKCVGCWKVYANEEAALKTFARFKKCTELYCDSYAKGRPIERLAVAGGV